jgi:hypothetical protein
MIRTQIQLPESAYEALKSAAHRTNRSMAACVREAVETYLIKSANADADFAQVAGRFRPMPMSDLKPHDRRLAEALLPRKKSS